MSRYHEINTGRPYTPEGQIIRFYTEPNETYSESLDVWFLDTARNIIGLVEDIPDYLSDPQGYALRCYDNTTYTSVTFSSRGIREIIRHYGDKA